MAYDPRDFQDDNESNKMPRLTLMEEVLLLGLKDKAVSPTRDDAAYSCAPVYVDEDSSVYWYWPWHWH